MKIWDRLEGLFQETSGARGLARRFGRDSQQRGDPQRRSGGRSLPMVPIVLLSVCLVLPALFPFWIAPQDPLRPNLLAAFAPPVFAGGDWTHILGTDAIGRDIFSRIVYGARVSAILALLVVGVSGIVGTAFGIIAGYVGGWVEAIIMRAADALFSLPIILVAIAMAALVGPSFTIIVIVLSMALWSQYVRLARAETVSISQRDYVTYARATGVSTLNILWRHVRPNLQNTIVVLATLHVGWAILTEAGLSFLGAGVPPPSPAWGTMVADGRIVLVQAWWVSLIPGLMIVFVVLSVNMLGDWMRDRFDPRLQPVTEQATVGGVRV